MVSHFANSSQPSNTTLLSSTDALRPYCVTYTYPDVNVLDFECRATSAAEIKTIYTTYVGGKIDGTWKTVNVDLNSGTPVASSIVFTRSSKPTGVSISIPVSAASATTSTTTSKKSSIGPIVGGVAGGLAVVVAVVVAALLVIIMRSKKNKAGPTAPGQSFISQQHMSQPPPGPHLGGVRWG